METLRHLCLLGWMLCVSLAATAQMESRLTFRHYTIQDGLPQMQCERLFQDTRGYIYVGTLSGFVRFDGHAFTAFLKGRRFNIVGFTEVEGTVSAFDFRRQWLTDYDGVTMRMLEPHGRWLLNNFNSGMLPNGYVLLEDEQEEHRRLCRVTTDGFTTIVKGALLDWMTPDRKLCMDSTTLYVPTEKGLYRVEGGKARRLTAKGDIYSLLRSGSTLQAFAADGIYDVTGHGLRLRTACDFPSASYGLTVRTLANGHLVMADEHSLYEYDGRQLRQLATGFNLVKDLLVDRWDRLWVATYEGLYCYFNRCFTTHRLTVEGDIVRAIGVMGGDTLVMGTLNGKLCVGDSIVNDDPSQFYAPNAATIYNKVYMAGNGDVMCYDGRLQRLHLPAERYLFVAKAGGRLIVGSRKCLTAYDPACGRLDTLTTSIPHPWCAADDGQGRLWVGTTFGLYCDGQKAAYEPSATPGGIHQEGERLIVTTMERDAQGNILFPSKDSLFVICNGKVSPLDMPGLAGHEVRALHVSPKGYLVVAVIDGLFVSRISRDYVVSDTRFYDHRNGFTMLEPLMATMGETADDTIWLTGIEEMTSFRPSDLLAYDEEDTYIDPPLRWWQHWWVWLIVLALLSLVVWAVTRWYEKRRHRRRMMRLQRENIQREEQIAAIRQKAIEETKASTLAKDIVKMTEHNIEQRITLRTASGTIVVDVKDIVYFKGDGNYSQIVTFYTKDTVLMGLGALEKMLDNEIFVRADRSTLVNIHHVCTLLPKQRRCIFRSPTGQEIETTLLAPAFSRLQQWLETSDGR